MPNKDQPRDEYGRFTSLAESADDVFGTGASTSKGKAKVEFDVLTEDEDVKTRLGHLEASIMSIQKFIAELAGQHRTIVAAMNANLEKDKAASVKKDQNLRRDCLEGWTRL